MVSKQPQAGRQGRGAAGAGQGVTRLDGDQQPRRQRLGLDVLPGCAAWVCGFDVRLKGRGNWRDKSRAPTAPGLTARSQQPRVKKQPRVKGLRD
jgi:hypothetical protein